MKRITPNSYRLCGPFYVVAAVLALHGTVDRGVTAFDVLTRPVGRLRRL